MEDMAGGGTGTSGRDITAGAGAAGSEADLFRDWAQALAAAAGAVAVAADGAAEAAEAVVDSVPAAGASAAAERAEAGDTIMKLVHFISKVDDDAVAAAIKEAESKSTGHIRVLVSHRKVTDPIERAQKHFLTHGLARTPHRNGVLIFVAPRTHKFAIIGDQAVHEKCGEEFWAKVAGEMTERFKNEQWTEALLHGINKAGQLLAEHFPREEKAQSVATDDQSDGHR